MDEKEKRTRDWAFTLNNWKRRDYKTIEALAKTAVYCVVGKEGKDKTPHLQGYIYWKNGKTWSRVKKLLPDGTHFDRAIANALKNQKYCTKEGDAKEWGTIPIQGRRNDIVKTREALQDGTNMRGIISGATNNQSISYAAKWLTYFEKERDWKTEVHWYYGETETFKSKTAHEENPHAFWSTKDNQWWDGYDAHKTVIIDDMRGDFCKFHELLRLLDRYPLKVAIKGGFRSFLAQKLIITSSKSPTEMYQYRTDEDLKQLHRRIDVLKHFTKKGK